MDLDQFVYDLHFDTDKARPPDWETDWQDAPLAYKLYRHLPTIPLAADVPLTLDSQKASAQPKLREIGHFLWYVFGLTQIRQDVFAEEDNALLNGPLQLCRRYAPSGGALYPNEMYIYLNISDAPVGVYHYDSAHHRLVLLREGRYDAYLSRTLGNRCDLSACFGVVLVSTMFWKNFYKYNNFSCRLQGLDAGVLIGQLLEVAKRFGFEPGVYVQFVDRAVNHLLGLSEQEESVYAVVPLSADAAIEWFADGNEGHGSLAAEQLSGELPPVMHEHYVRSRNIVGYPMLVRMNEASFLDSAMSFRQISGTPGVSDKVEKLELPQAKRLSYDLAAVCRARYSPETEFVMGRVTREELAALLQEVSLSFPYRNDMDGTQGQTTPRVALYGCIYGVDGIPDGAYRYDDVEHSLQPVCPGDQRYRLQRGMSLGNVSLFQVPVCLHIAGDKGHLRRELGYRGYRIQQMEAGMLVQRILLAASALGIGGRPLLGFDAKLCDQIYGLAQYGQTALIQIPIGRSRQRSGLEGGLHS
jgi:SagB-type dehydrogenase family enzyme